MGLLKYLAVCHARKTAKMIAHVHGLSRHNESRSCWLYRLAREYFSKLTRVCFGSHEDEDEHALQFLMERNGCVMGY